jgi:O-antigen/teichoic acid export membrane protein
VLLYFFSEELFVLFLGEKWRVAGVYARVLVPLFWMRFITAPLSLTNIVFEKQKIALFWQLGLLLLTLIIFLVVYYEHYSFFSFMYLYVIVLALYYVFLLVIVNNVAKGK